MYIQAQEELLLDNNKKYFLFLMVSHYSQVAFLVLFME